MWKIAEDDVLVSNSKDFCTKRALVSKLGISLNKTLFFLTSLSVGLSLKNFVFNLLFGGIN